MNDGPIIVGRASDVLLLLRPVNDDVVVTSPRDRRGAVGCLR